MLMDYNWYIAYHLRGDASVEERFAARYVKEFHISDWDAFRFLYYYSLTYNLPSAIRLLDNPRTPKTALAFRTDRRYVGICGRFEKCMAALNKSMFSDVIACKTTHQQYQVVSKWYYFGRYAAYLFLECFYNLWPCPVDDLRMKYDPKENYTKGAIISGRVHDQPTLDAFVDRAKADTHDNVYSIETSLCAVEKIKKGTRWDGFYTERLINELVASKLPLIRLVR